MYTSDWVKIPEFFEKSTDDVLNQVVTREESTTTYAGMIIDDSRIT